MAVDRAARMASEARRILVLTGAGVSAESGVPTFRGEGGLWRDHRPEDLATPSAFAKDPMLVLEWYGLRRETVSACRPNPAHEAIARACVSAEGQVSVVTQNVDGLHARALRDAWDARHGGDPASGETGSPIPSRLLPIELHGSLFRDRCNRCSYRELDPGQRSGGGLDPLPTCPKCASLMRPDVVWFGESLDPEILEAAFAAASEADLCLVVGTSSVVEPAASIPRLAASAGARLVEVNPERTPISALAAVRVRAPAALAVPAILSARRGGLRP